MLRRVFVAIAKQEAINDILKYQKKPIQKFELVFCFALTKTPGCVYYDNPQKQKSQEHRKRKMSRKRILKQINARSTNFLKWEKRILKVN